MSDLRERGTRCIGCTARPSPLASLAKFQQDWRKRRPNSRIACASRLTARPPLYSAPRLWRLASPGHALRVPAFGYDRLAGGRSFAPVWWRRAGRGGAVVGPSPVARVGGAPFWGIGRANV